MRATCPGLGPGHRDREARTASGLRGARTGVERHGARTGVGPRMTREGVGPRMTREGVGPRGTPEGFGPCGTRTGVGLHMTREGSGPRGCRTGSGLRATRKGAGLHGRVLLSVLVLAGCTVGPDYRPVRPPSPAFLGTRPARAEAIARTDASLRHWWASFGDPVLDVLIADAIDGNLDLRRASARIEEARADQREAEASFYPRLSGAASFGEQHEPINLEYPPLPDTTSTFNRQWQLGFQASWEIDVFGRVRRQVEVSERAVDVSIEDRRGVLVSLLAQVADAYATLRASQARLSIAERNVHAVSDALALVDRLFEQGLGTSLQVAQQRAELESEQATLPPLRAAVADAAHALAVLTGQLPERYTSILSEAAPLPTVPAMPASLPSSVIANRPDIRTAERQYALSVARVGVAVADLYPQFTIPLTLEPTASEVRQVFEGANVLWQATLSATAPIYQGGRLRAQVRAARAQADEARLSYEQTVLAAFRDVEDGITAYETDTARDRALAAASADSALALQRSEILYSHGLTGFLDVLTAERTVFAADDAKAVSDLALLEDAVGLYRAFGAGWQGADLAPHLPVTSEEEKSLARRPL